MKKIKLTKGFTLIEVAIVLAIVGIIMAGMFGGMGALRESAKFKEDQRKLQDIKSALISYVAVNGYLPCPTNPNDGNTGLQSPPENRATTDGSCDVTFGYLPYADIGSHSVNAYGLPFSYSINTGATADSNTKNKDHSASYFGASNCDINNGNPPCFNSSTPPTATNLGSGNFNICKSIIGGNCVDPLAQNIPLVVISHGQNSCANASNLEQENCNQNQNYLQATQARSGSNAFDDVLIWLSSLEIKNAAPGVLSSRRGGDDNDTENGPVNPDDSPLDIPLDVNTFQATITSDDGSNIEPEGSNSEGDSIKITENLEATDDDTSFDLGQGHDKLYILQDVNREITGGQQTKEIYVGGDVNANITLNGNDEHIIEIGARAYLSDGTWGVHGGSLNANLELTSNSINQITIWGSITENGRIESAKNNQDTNIYIGQDLKGRILIDGGIVYFGKASISITEYTNIIGATSIMCRSSTGFVNCS